MPFSTSEAVIATEEGRLAIRLPASFREYLKRSNGGDVAARGDHWQIFPAFDTSDRKHMSRTANHLARETALARHWTGFPPTAVAFAANGAGDRLVFLPLNEAAQELDSAVFHWDHETGQLVRIAPDFAMLQPSVG